MNCMAETKHQTSIAPTLQRNEKRDTLAQYNQYEEEEVVKELLGWVLPYLGYTGTCRWTGYGFLASLSLTGYTIWLASVLNRFKTCPKQGMVLPAKRLKPRLQAVSFFSSWALQEVERA